MWLRILDMADEGPQWLKWLTEIPVLVMAETDEKLA